MCRSHNLWSADGMPERACYLSGTSDQPSPRKPAMSRFLFGLFFTVCALHGARLSCAADKPNFVIIFCDDLGYGDLSTFGHPTIKTPRLDAMAAEGQKWTNFYVAACVCTPSRAGLLTGRLPIRNGMCSDKRRVLFPDSAKGLPPSEITIATALKKEGYRTAAVGKWHRGGWNRTPKGPKLAGFDRYCSFDYPEMFELQKEGRGGNCFWWTHLWQDDRRPGCSVEGIRRSGGAITRLPTTIVGGMQSPVDVCSIL